MDADVVQVESVARLNFIYSYCRDIDGLRAFYTDFVGLKEKGYVNDGQWAWLNYDLGGIDLIFMPDEQAAPADGWAAQPGWEGGTKPVVSWSVVVPLERLRRQVRACEESGYDSFAPEPSWAQDSYWSFPVRDPAGNTVELHAMPKERPASVWEQDAGP